MISAFWSTHGAACGLGGGATYTPHMWLEVRGHGQKVLLETMDTQDELTGIGFGT